MNPAPRPYDFRQPQPEPPEVQRQVLAWVSALTHQWTELLRRQFGLPWTLQIEIVRRCYFQSTIAELQENMLYYPVQWSAHAGSLLGVSRPLALALALAMLGEPCTTLPAQRPLTAIESSLWEYVLAQRLLAGVKTCWIREPVPQWQVGQREQAPQFSPVLKNQPTALLLDMRCQELPADGCIVWFLSETVLHEFFSAARPDSAPPLPPQQLFQDIPLQLTVHLGQATLPLAQLERLRNGDVLLLEQCLNDPLVVFLEDQPRYLAWPGRVGNRRAVQITAYREEGPS